MTLQDKLKAEPVFSYSESCIMSPEFEQFRLQALNISRDVPGVPLDIEVVRRTPMDVSMFGGSPPSNTASEFPLEIVHNAMQFHQGDSKTWLHWAARTADVPLAYEIIRMGIDIDCKDKDGVTPLFLAFLCLFSQSTLRKAVTHPTFRQSLPPSLQSVINSVPTLQATGRNIKNMMHIITLLIEQHADVNVCAFGYTPLALAAEFGQWDAANLLIIHGAKRIRPQLLRIASQSDKSRLSSMQDEISPAQPRPTRPCPCWSGKPLSECHDASEMPYPNYFLCRCGARKMYAACCGKRGLGLREHWNSEEKRIEISQWIKLYMPDVLPDIQPEFEAGLRMAMDFAVSTDPRRFQEMFVEGTKRRGEDFTKWLRILGREEDVDPAYMYAFSHTDFFPRPWCGHISKLEAQSRMDEWNTEVDKYISNKCDPRSTLEIEVEDKIGLHGGPLHRRCEAKNCSNIEGRDVEKLKYCSGCKLVYYCSEACQLKSWRRHKTDCVNRTHRAQVLPSQWTMEQVVAVLSAASADLALERADSISSPEHPLLSTAIMPSSASHPCLPQGLLDDLKTEPAFSVSESRIFSSDLEEFRLDALDLEQSDPGAYLEMEITEPLMEDAILHGMAGSGFPGQLMQNTVRFRPGDKKTYLHWAVRQADVPLTYEMIRMGIDIDCKDREGVTPLFLATECLFSQCKMIKGIADPWFLQRYPPDIQAILVAQADPEAVANHIKCLTRIITLLVEQHADVNVSVFGCTPLYVAAEAGQWEVAELLITHGARRVRPESLQTASRFYKTRLSSLQNKARATNPRPARPCPCWSGKLLAECHAASKIRYPDHFLCRCGTRKVYGACCGKRGTELEEHWNGEEKRIKTEQRMGFYDLGVEAEIQHDYEIGLQQVKQMLANADDDDDMDGLEWKEEWIKYLRTTGRVDNVDPAYMYAFYRTDFFPRPWGGCISKLRAQKLMKVWNTKVDEYIRNEGDTRSAREIEIEAKIGVHGGPLYRRCEAEGCNNIEGREIEKVKYCGRCKLAFYCSNACQRKGWKYHREECSEKKHRAQVLPAQRFLEQAVAEMVARTGKHLKTNGMRGQ
ncbi:hypothetical protein NM688_g4837 [Phlebia brevispora]|uniref:Uncharacterized protein n=1 Tax=Phlebia brevispora TaxID=194682 RepID=A0ACC1T1Z7_9APHY|nr:hypothetical protein NM688_g4837 [Phlebia brevispora]